MRDFERVRLGLARLEEIAWKFYVHNFFEKCIRVLL